MNEDLKNVMNVKLNVEDLENFKCPKCSNQIFLPTFILKEVPGLVVGSKREKEIIPIPSFFVCAACGTIIADAKQNDTDEKRNNESKIVTP